MVDNTHIVAINVKKSKIVCQSYSIINEQYKRIPKNIAVNSCVCIERPRQDFSLKSLWARIAMPMKWTNSAIMNSVS